MWRRQAKHKQQWKSPLKFIFTDIGIFLEVYTAGTPPPPPPRNQYAWTIAEGDINDASSGIFFAYTCFDTASNPASDTHPTLVTSWVCQEGSQTSSLITDTPFSLTCGCSIDDDTTDEDATDEYATEDESSDDNDGGSEIGSTSAAASSRSSNNDIFSATAGKMMVGLVASVLGTILGL